MVVEKNKKDVVKMSFEKIIYKLTDKRIPADTHGNQLSLKEN